MQLSDPGSSSGEFCSTMPTKNDRDIAEKWIIDTVSSKHMTSSTVNLNKWNPCVPPEKVMLEVGRGMIARGNGEGRIIGFGLENGSVEIKIKELLLVPELSVNVLAVTRITDEGNSVHFTIIWFVHFSSKDCRIMDAETPIVEFYIHT